MPVPFIVLRLLDEIDRAGLWVEVDERRFHVTPKAEIPPGLREDLWVEREDLYAYLSGVKRIRELEDLDLPHNSPQLRWPRCWWKYRSEWDSEKARDAERGLVQEGRP